MRLGRTARGAAMFVAVGVFACKPSVNRAADEPLLRPRVSDGAPPPAVDAGPWRDRIEPSTPERPADPLLAGLVEACGTTDAALSRAAARLAERALEGAPPADGPQLRHALRSEGSALVWPRSWSIAGHGAPPDDLPARVRDFVASMSDDHVRRCGAGLAGVTDGEWSIVLVTAQEWARVEAMPSRVPLGRPVTLRLTMSAGATAHSLIAMGPSGRPEEQPLEAGEGTLTLSVVPDRAGAWLVQLVADTQLGPRPAAEVELLVGGAPAPGFEQAPVPGEAVARAADEHALLRAMVLEARRVEGVGSLTARPDLDALAQAHADDMARRRVLGHDVGSGPPDARATQAGITFRALGENVAHAATVARAHRAIWDSPAHRRTLLEQNFRELGIGVAADSDGSVWVCEIFADR